MQMMQTHLKEAIGKMIPAALKKNRKTIYLSMIKTDTRAETFAPNSFMQNHQKIIEFIFRTKETNLQTILYVNRNKRKI